MSESSINPFASPVVSAADLGDPDRPAAVEIRPVSYSGKLTEEEAHLLAGQKTIEWTDSILLMPVFFAAATTIYHLVVHGFQQWPDSSIVPIFVGVLFYSLLVWWPMKMQPRYRWEKEAQEGSFSQNEVRVRFEQSEINLTIAEHATVVSSQGIRIRLGNPLERRQILISRNWFHPGEFEMACEIIRQAKPIEAESLQLYSTLRDLPESAVPFYQLGKRRRRNCKLMQFFSSWVSLLLGAFFLTMGTILLPLYWSIKTIWMTSAMPLTFLVLGIFLVFAFVIARTKIYYSMSNHPLLDPSERDLLGWCDSNGLTMLTRDGVVRSAWLEHMHYSLFADSLNLFYPLLTPRLIGIFPGAFESREDWLKAKSIITASVSTTSEFLQKNKPSFLKLVTFGRVR